MTFDRCAQALARARKEERHAQAMITLAMSDAARKRHERRLITARRRIADARRDLACSGEVYA